MTLYRFDGAAPRIPGDSWVAPSADVIGDVTLGHKVTILFGAIIRADNGTIAIGDETNVQDGAVLHSDPGVPLTIGARVTIGHKAILHGCTIADDVLVGMGSTVLNGAVIGAGSLVGANALVTEGKTFPPGSLIVGAPAKAIRQLSDAEQANLRLSAAGYVDRGAAFARGLAAIDPASAADQASGPE